MAPDAHKNFATSTVATAPSPATSGTSLVVASGEGSRFPATPFNAVVCPVAAIPTPSNAEVVRVTTVSTDTFTITRAQESSSARSVVVGDRIYAGPTAKSLTDIEGNHAAVGSITTIQPDDAAAAGSATTWARGDHKHAIVTDTASTLSGTNAEGTSTSFARADHNHGMPLLGRGGAIPPPIQSAPVSGTSGVANTWYAIPFGLIVAWTITGVRFRCGSAASGNVRSALYDANGAQLAANTTGATQGTANLAKNIPFDSTYLAAPGYYFALMSFFNAAATWWGARIAGPTITGTNATTVPSSLSVPALTSFEDADRPILMPY